MEHMNLADYAMRAVTVGSIAGIVGVLAYAGMKSIRFPHAGESIDVATIYSTGLISDHAEINPDFEHSEGWNQFGEVGMLSKRTVKIRTNFKGIKSLSQADSSLFSDYSKYNNLLDSSYDLESFVIKDSSDMEVMSIVKEICNSRNLPLYLSKEQTHPRKIIWHPKNWNPVDNYRSDSVYD